MRKRIRIKRPPQRKRQLEIRLRYLHIWQKTGNRPFRKASIHREPIECSSCGTVFDSPYCPNCGLQYRSKLKGSFYRGAFDSVPFLNDDAKRTFLHLIFRPGYMIRDYISGHTSRYMAPLTSLIIFYAFFTLVFSVVAPAYKTDKVKAKYNQYATEMNMDLTVNASNDSIPVSKFISGVNTIREKYAMCYGLLNLDSLPELIDSPVKASIASLEASLRSQGIPIFIGYLIILTLAFHAILRKKYGMSFSACASLTAYLLCQFCFYMLFAILITWGEKIKIKDYIMAALIAWDLHQLLGIKWKRSIWLVFKTAIVSYVIIGILFVIAISAMSIMIWQ